MSGILIDVKANTTQAEKDLANINKSIKNIETSTKGVSDSLKQMFVSLGGLVAVGGSLAYVKNIATEFKQLENRIATVTGRNKELLIIQRQLLDITRETRSTLKGTVTTYTTIGRALQNSTQSSKNIMQVTKSINQTFAIAGASAESAQGATIQLGQAFASGVLRGDELNTVMEQAPGIIQAITKELRITQGELRAMAAEGKITGDIVFKSILAQSKNINKEFSTLTPTFANASQSFALSMKVFTNEFDKGLGLTDSLGGSIAKIATKIFEASDAALELGANITIAYYGVKSNLLGFIALLKTSFISIGKSISNSIPSNLLENLFSGNFIEGASKLKKIFISTFNAISKESEKVVRTIFYSHPELIRTATSVTLFANRVKNTFKDLFDRVTGQDSWSGMMQNIKDKASNLWSSISSGMNSFKANFLKIFDDIAKVMSTLSSEIFKGNFALTFSFSVDIARAVSNIKTAYAIIKDKVSSMASSVNITDMISKIPSLLEGLLASVMSNSVLNTVLSTLQTFGNNVIEVFYQIYDKVIGHSWWTDTISTIVDTSKSLWLNVSPSLLVFQTNIISIFKTIYDTVAPYSDKLSNVFTKLSSKTPSSVKINIDSLHSKETFSDKLSNVFTNFSSKTLSSFKINIDLTHSKEAFSEFVEKAKTKLSEVGDTLPGVVKAALYGIGFLLVSNLFPKDKIAKSLATALLLGFAGTTTIFLDELIKVLTNRQLVSEFGTGLGEGAAIFVESFIKEIPKLSNAFVGLVSSFTQSFLSDLPIIGAAMTALFGVADTFGGGGVLGLVSIVLFGMGITSVLKSLGIITGAVDIFGVRIMSMVAFFTGRGGVISTALFGGPNAVRIVATLLSILDAFDGFDSLFGDSKIAHTIASGGLLYLMLYGKTGLTGIMGNFRRGIVDPILSGMHRTIRDVGPPRPGTSGPVAPTGPFNYMSGAGRPAPTSVLMSSRDMTIDLLRTARAKIDGFTSYASDKFQAFSNALSAMFTRMSAEAAVMSSGMRIQLAGAFATGQLTSALGIITAELAAFDARMRIMAGPGGMLYKFLFGKGGIMLLVGLVAIFGVSLASASDDFQKNLEPKKGMFAQIADQFKEFKATWHKGWGLATVEFVAAMAGIYVGMKILIAVWNVLFRVEIPLAVTEGMVVANVSFSAGLKIMWTKAVIAAKVIGSALTTIGTGLGPTIGKAMIGVGTAIGRLVQIASPIGVAVGGALLGGIAGRLAGGEEMASIGAMLGAGLAFSFSSVIVEAVTGLFAWIGITTIAAFGLFVAGATAVGVIGLWLFGSSGNVLTELELVYEKTKAILGLKPKESTSVSTGLTRSAEDFAKTLPLQLSYNLNQINFELLGDKEKSKIIKVVKDLNESLSKAADDFENGLLPTPDTLNAISAMVKKANMLGAKAEAKTTVDYTKLPQNLLNLRNIGGNSLAERMALSVNQIAISWDRALIHANVYWSKVFSIGEKSNKFAAAAKRNYETDVARGRYTVGGQAPSPRETDVMSQLASLKNIKIDPSIETTLNKLTDNYYNLFKVVEDSKGFGPLTILRAPPEDVVNAFLDQIDVQILWAKQNARSLESIENFNRKLLAISANLKKINITFDSDNILFESDAAIERLRALGEEAAYLAEQLKLPASAAEHNNIVLRIQEVTTKVTAFTVKSESMDNTRKQFKLVEDAAKAGIKGVTEEFARMIPDDMAEKFHKEWTAIAADLESMKNKPIANLEPIGTPLSRFNYKQTLTKSGKTIGEDGKSDAQKIIDFNNVKPKLPLSNQMKLSFELQKEAQKAFKNYSEKSFAGLVSQADLAGVNINDALSRIADVDTIRPVIARINELNDLISESKRTGSGVGNLVEYEREINNLKESLTKIEPQAFTNLIGNLGLNLSLKDVLLLSPEAYKNLDMMSRAVTALDLELQKNGEILSQADMNKKLAEKAALIESAFQSAQEVVFSTGAKINQALSNMGATKEQINILPQSAKDKLLSYSLILESLKKALEEPVSPDGLNVINKAVENTEKSVKSLLDQFTSVEAALGNINSVFKTSLSAVDLSGFNDEFFVNTRAMAEHFKTELEAAMKDGKITEASKSIFKRMNDFAREGTFISMFTDLSRNLELAISGGAISGFEKLKSVYGEYAPKFEEYAQMAPKERRQSVAKAGYVEAYKKASDLPGLTKDMADQLNKLDATGSNIEEVMKGFKEKFGEALKTETQKLEGTMVKNNELLGTNIDTMKNLITTFLGKSDSTVPNINSVNRDVMGIESSGGLPGSFNSRNGAMGKMSVTYATLQDPGHGMKPFQGTGPLPERQYGTDKQLTDASKAELKTYVIANEAALQKFGEDFLSVLIKKAGSVSGGLKAYRGTDQDPKYQALFEKYKDAPISSSQPKATDVLNKSVATAVAKVEVPIVTAIVNKETPKLPDVGEIKNLHIINNMSPQDELTRYKEALSGGKHTQILKGAISQSAMVEATTAQLKQAAELQVKIKEINHQIELDNQAGGKNVQSLTKTLTDVTESFTNVVTAMDSGALAMKEAGKSFSSNITSTFGSSLSALLQGKQTEGKTKFGTFFQSMTDSFTSSVVDTFSKGVTEKLMGPGSSISKVMENAGSSLFSLPSAIGNSLSGASGGGMGDWMSNLLSGGSSSAPDAASQAIVDNASKNKDAIVAAIKGTAMGGAVASMFGGKGGTISDFFSSITGGPKAATASTPMSGLIGGAKMPTSDMEQLLGGGATKVTPMMSPIEGAAPKLSGGFLSDIGDSISKTFSGLFGEGGSITGMLGKMGSGLMGLFKDAGSLLSSAGGGIMSMLGGAGSGIMSLFAATGGSISGPGTGTSDSIPTMLSDGEFVVNAKSAAQHGDLLKSINSGKPLVHRALGGMVSGASSLMSGVTSAVSTASSLSSMFGVIKGVLGGGPNLSGVDANTQALIETNNLNTDKIVLAISTMSASSAMGGGLSGLSSLFGGDGGGLGGGISSFFSSSGGASGLLGGTSGMGSALGSFGAGTLGAAEGIGGLGGVGTAGSGLLQSGLPTAPAGFGSFGAEAPTGSFGAGASGAAGSGADSGGMMASVTDAMSKVGTSISDTFSGLFGDKGSVSSLFEGFGGTLTDMMGGLGDTLAPIGGMLMEAGSQVADMVMKIVTSFLAEGGPVGTVKGPGTGTSDSIPAMLSNGEFVVNAKSAGKHASLLTAINSGNKIGHLAMGGFADGGSVTPSFAMGPSPIMPNIKSSSLSGGSGGSRQTVNLNITGDISRQTKSEIYKMMPSIADGVNTHNREKNYRR